MEINLIRSLINNCFVYNVNVDDICLYETITKDKKLAKIYYKNIVKNKGKLVNNYREENTLKKTTIND